jgi:putative inorganic carbon (HCO3(-)) transporter
LNQPPEQASALTQNLALAVAVLFGIYLLFTSTVTLSDTLWPYDVKRILQLAILPIIFGLVLLNAELRSRFQTHISHIPRWLFTSLLVFIALGVISAVVNNQTKMAVIYALSEVLLLGLLIPAMFCIAVCRVTVGAKFDQTMVLMISVMAFAVGLQELMGILSAWASGIEFSPRIALLHFSWPRFYNQIQSWTMPVISALPLLFPGKKSAKFFCIGALSLGWYVMIATGGRGSFVGVTAALVIGLVIFPAIRKTIIRYQLTSLLGGLFIYLLVIWGHQGLAESTLAVPGSEQTTSTSERLDHQADTIKKPESAGSESFTSPLSASRMASSSGRMRIWAASVDDARSNPWLGNGPMGYACKGPVYREGHPHNFLMQILGEWGIPAFIIILIISAYLFFRLPILLRKSEGQSDKTNQVACLFALGVLAAAIHACVSGVMVMPASLVAAILISGSLLGLVPIKPSSALSGRSGLVVIGLSFYLSIAFLAFGHHELSISELRQEQTPLFDRLIPRLWQNGKVCALYQP